MPYCAVANCKNKSDQANMKKGGISYHQFPKEPNTKEKWIDATGRKNWFPTKYSTICSSHFSDEDFDDTKKIRKLAPNVYPKINVWIKDETHDNPTTSYSHKRKIMSTASVNDGIITETSRKKKLRKQLTRAKNVILQQKLKVKRLQEQNRRKMKKILNLQEIIYNLKKFSLMKEGLKY